MTRTLYTDLTNWMIVSRVTPYYTISIGVCNYTVTLTNNDITLNRRIPCSHRIKVATLLTSSCNIEHFSAMVHVQSFRDLPNDLHCKVFART